MASMWSELKRRNVVRVSIAYVIVAWLVLQIVDVISPILELPLWVSRTILVFLMVGLVISLVVAWAYELTPEGVKREKEVDRTQSITHTTGRKLDFVIIGVLTIALAFFAFERFVLHEHGDAAIVPNVDLEKSIAILPFANRSANAADVYFVDGIHDDILTQLHKLSGIDKVISRTSVERYRVTDLSMPEIAAELGVATILEGGVQRSGNRVRINVQLIDAANDGHLWAEDYERELTAENVFDIQGEISTAIATALQAALTEDEADDLNILPTDSLAAWEQYQLGKHDMRDRSLDGLARAREYFSEAIAIDPEFALAYVGLADALNLTVVYSWSSVDGITKEKYIQLIASSQAAAERALTINPRLGEAYAALGYSHWNLAAYPEFGRASVLQSDAHYRRALELAPNYADVYRWYAQTIHLHPLNNPADALKMAQRAVALDPMLNTNHQVLGTTLEMNGHYEQALQAAARAMQITPGYRQAIEDIVNYHRRHGAYASAIVEGRLAVNQDLHTVMTLESIALSYRQLGDTELFEFWAGRTNAYGNNFFDNDIAAFKALDRRDYNSAMQSTKAAMQDWSQYWDGIHMLARLYVLQGDDAGLLKFVAFHTPDILAGDSPIKSPRSAMLAAPAVWALTKSGERAQAEQVLELSLASVNTDIRQADWGYGSEIADIELHVLRGDTRKALSALTRAVEEGYRNTDWLMLSPFVGPIRDEPEFIAAMEVIRTDLAAQLALLEAMERNGELPPLPE